MSRDVRLRSVFLMYPVDVPFGQTVPALIDGRPHDRLYDRRHFSGIRLQLDRGAINIQQIAVDGSREIMLSPDFRVVKLIGLNFLSRLLGNEVRTGTKVA